MRSKEHLSVQKEEKKRLLFFNTLYVLLFSFWRKILSKKEIKEKNKCEPYTVDCEDLVLREQWEQGQERIIALQPYIDKFSLKEQHLLKSSLWSDYKLLYETYQNTP